MKRKVLLISCLLVFVLGCNLIPASDAATFDIGEELDCDLTWIPFTSGAVAYADYGNNVTAIFDGNLSTGINFYDPSSSNMHFEINLPQPLFITNITMKPNFGGGNCSYYLFIKSFDSSQFPYWPSSGERILHVNSTIYYLELDIISPGGNRFYFNDVIINYTPDASNSTEILKDINEFRNILNSFQNQIINFNNQFIDLNNKTTYLNNSLNTLNQIQKQILENITNLRLTYDKLNNTIQKLKTEINDLNSTIYQNITQLENNLIIIEKDINNIQQTVDNLTLDIDQLPALKDQINNTLLDIFNLNQNFTILQESIPEEFDDTALKSQILTLEDENTNLKLEIGNLTSEIDNLNTEINDLNTELNGFKSDLDELKEHDVDEEDDDDGESEGSSLAYGGIGVGIIGVILALIAISMLLKKKSPPTMPLEEKEVPSSEMAPEQPVVEKTGGVVEQEQPEGTPEGQEQESVRIQQQEGLG